jgi:hypothetical protein
MFGIQNELAETIALEIASVFDGIFRQCERTAIDWLFRIGWGCDLLFGFNKPVDVDFARHFVLANTLADVVIGIGLSVGLAYTLLDCLGERFKQFCFGGFFQSILWDIIQKCFAIMLASGFVADTKVDLVFRCFASPLCSIEKGDEFAPVGSCFPKGVYCFDFDVRHIWLFLFIEGVIAVDELTLPQMLAGSTIIFIFFSCLTNGSGS